MRWIVFRVLCAVLLFVSGVFSVHAETLTSVRIRTSRNVVSLSTDVEVQFVATAGVDAGSDTIQLTFPSGFSVAALTNFDVALFHGMSGLETQETVKPSAGVDQWGASFSGQTLTLTPPTDTGIAEIPVNDVVIIRIGTNSGGVNQATNPSLAGQYQWVIEGAFGGIAAPFSAIVQSAVGGFSVGFSIADSSSGGGGGGGGGGSGAEPSGSLDEDKKPTYENPDAPAPVADETKSDVPPSENEQTPSSDEKQTDADSGTEDVNPSSPTSPTPVSAPTVRPSPSTTGAPPQRGSVANSGGSQTGIGGSRLGGSLSGGGAATSPTSSQVTPASPSSASTTVPSFVPLIPTALLPPSQTPTSTTNAPSPSAEKPRVYFGQLVWRYPSGASLIRPEHLRVYTGDTVTVLWKELPAGALVLLEMDGTRYILNERTEGYQLSFVPRETGGSSSALLKVQTREGKTFEEQIQVAGVPAYRVKEAQEKETKPLAGVSIEVRVRQGGAWTVATQLTSDAQGLVRSYLPAGTYQFSFKKEGYKTVREEKTLTSGAWTGERVLERGIQNPLKVIDPSVSVTKNVANVAVATAEAAAQVIETLRTPETQIVAEVVAPVAVLASVSATAAAASSFNILSYLRFLFTQPMMLIRRRKREKWGMVYNAITKQPIDLAIIRLLDAATGVIKQTRVSDAQGRFAFLVGTGTYKLQVVKPAFTFPSVTLASERIDIDLVDLYHGEPVTVKESTTITPNIPVDPQEQIETPKTIIRKKYLRQFQRVVGIGGLGLAGISVLIQPTKFMIGFAILQVGLFFLFRRLAIPAKPKNWGIVYDNKTRKPLGKVIVRIFDKKYNKLLETQLTADDGKYAFFAGKNIYYVTADHQGYEKFISKELDLRKEAMGVVREPLALVAK